MPMNLKRITNELAGVHESRNRKAIDDNFQEIATKALSTDMAQAIGATKNTPAPGDRIIGFDSANGNAPSLFRVSNGAARTKPLIVVECGNSMPGYGNYDAANSGFAATCETLMANMLAGAALRKVNIAPGTRVDAYGVHSYGGQQCPAIIADIIANWFPTITAAGIVPDVVWIPDAIVNDLSSDVPAATCKLRFAQLLSVIRAKWPGVAIAFDTVRGHASFTPGSARRIACDDVCDWMLTLDDGLNTFVTELRGAWGDLSAADPQYTPDGTHPTPRGAMACARRKAVTIRRISAVHGGGVGIGTNPWLIGSSAASGTGVSGTWPTGCSHTAQSGPSTVTLTALNPGVRLAYATTGEADTGQFSAPGVSPDIDLAYGGRVSMSATVRLVSGAQYLRFIRPELRLYYSAATGGGNDWRYGLLFPSASNAVYPQFLDDDLLHITLPYALGTSPKSIVNALPYLRVGIVGGNSVTLEVLGMTPCLYAA